MKLMAVRAPATPASPTVTMTAAAQVRCQIAPTDAIMLQPSLQALTRTYTHEYSIIADVDACEAAPCNNGNDTAVCNDLPAPALGDAGGRTCSCEAPGFIYANDDTGCVGELAEWIPHIEPVFASQQ
jgi:hypothetical protein